MINAPSLDIDSSVGIQLLSPAYLGDLDGLGQHMELTL